MNGKMVRLDGIMVPMDEARRILAEREEAITPEAESCEEEDILGVESTSTSNEEYYPDLVISPEFQEMTNETVAFNPCAVVATAITRNLIADPIELIHAIQAVVNTEDDGAEEKVTELMKYTKVELRKRLDLKDISYSLSDNKTKLINKFLET